MKEYKKGSQQIDPVRTHFSGNSVIFFTLCLIMCGVEYDIENSDFATPNLYVEARTVLEKNGFQIFKTKSTCRKQPCSNILLSAILPHTDRIRHKVNKF